MCARRFLLLIVILTLLAVAGAFALFQLGDEILVRQSAPQGHYQEPAKSSEPRYGDASAWLARPDLADNPARWVPDGVVATTTTSPAALFYIHPTTYLERDRWNAPIALTGESANRARLFVESQASAFNHVADIWAPRYRQAAFGAFLLKSEDASRALDLAYRDVAAAFDHFISAIPQNKPVIVAGHSQGSLHLLRLLAERKAMLGKRLVAAYVVGWPVGLESDLPATGLPACAAADQPGCMLSWQSFRDPANKNLVLNAWVGTAGLTGRVRRAEDMLCVNPLTGTTGSAAPAANLGTIIPNGNMSSAALEPGKVGARCDDGFLLIDGDIPDLGPYVLPGNNYHVYDYALFWGSIRGDAERRLTAWRSR